MSNNDLWCSKCKSHHHPAEDCEEPMTAPDELKEIARDFCVWWNIGALNDVETKRACREDAINEMTEILCETARKERAKVLTDLHEKVMQLENRVGTLASMQAQVGGLILSKLREAV